MIQTHKFFFLLLLSSNLLFCQNNYFSGFSQLPNNRISNYFNNYIYNPKKIKSKKFNLSYNYHEIINSGHPNIDNNSEIYAPGTSSRLLSTRLSYISSWLTLELEPYLKTNKNLFSTSTVNLGTYAFNNNHNGYYSSDYSNNIGLRQSQVLVHYKGLGLSYGYLSHWWGHGLHSSITLSSNSPSNETYSIGTFKDINIGKFAFGAKIITIPYNNKEGDQIYFSGFKGRFVYNSNPTITFQFHRTFLSGDFNNLSSKTNFNRSWTFNDATNLVFEPLFGQEKTNLDYTIPGTPGFDPWDEIISGAINIYFPKDNLNLYLELASDDNRANITDLIAHWDHTLGYIIGANKLYTNGKYNFFLGIEYLSTKISNTYNPKFYRGNPNGSIYYAYEIYDYFTYKNRRMGAHSGPNSEDLFIILGLGELKYNFFLTVNREIHGLKSMPFPEIKNEVSFTINKNIGNYHNMFVTMELEKINNFSFTENNISISKVLWFGYSISIDW